MTRWWNKPEFQADRQRWLAEHPGQTVAGYIRACNSGEANAWRGAKAKAYYRAMRRAWLVEHPGDPLPEHLCALDHPLPGHKRWCAMAGRWIDRYEDTHSIWD